MMLIMSFLIDVGGDEKPEIFFWSGLIKSSLQTNGTLSSIIQVKIVLLGNPQDILLTMEYNRMHKHTSQLYTLILHDSRFYWQDQDN